MNYLYEKGAFPLKPVVIVSDFIARTYVGCQKRLLVFMRFVFAMRYVNCNWSYGDTPIYMKMMDNVIFALRIFTHSLSPSRPILP
jgi:hypothetical protein